MKKLSVEKRASILQCLVEGNSALSTSRITGVALNTVLDLTVEAGKACAAYMHKHMVNLPCKVLQLDEIWSFVGCKEQNKETAKGEHPGDVWLWKCICADTKLIPCWHLGDRSQASANSFCSDLPKRFSDKVQITSDGLAAYRWAIGRSFKEVHFAQLVKIYSTEKGKKDTCVGTRKVPVFGSPRHDLISTSYIERANLTLRMSNRRFTRKTNGYSKKLENHAHMIAIGIMCYNYTRRHHSLKQSPAQAAGLTTKLWNLDDIIHMMDNHNASLEREAFEAAFDAKFTAPRKAPKCHQPTPKANIPLPWYLNPVAGGELDKP